MAGALAAVPMGALAVTASAQAPEPTTDVALTPADAAGGEIADHPHRGDHDGPEGPRVRFHHPGDHPDQDGPHDFFLSPRPPSGSAG